MIARLVLFTLLISTSLFAEEVLILGIAGGTGSGKTTFAGNIKNIFGDQAALIEVDSYYKDLSHLSPAERSQANFDHPDSIDFKQLREHLLALKNHQPILKPIYDFATHTRTGHGICVQPAKIIIIEGILLFSVPEVRELCDIKLFIEVEDDIRLLRRMERDISERGRTVKDIQAQYLATVKPMHDCFVAPSKVHADVIIPTLGDTTEAEKIIIKYLSQRI